MSGWRLAVVTRPERSARRTPGVEAERYQAQLRTVVDARLKHRVLPVLVRVGKQQEAQRLLSVQRQHRRPPVPFEPLEGPPAIGLKQLAHRLGDGHGAEDGV
jgi:hypothetical protein